ncbi:DUF885 family protein [Paracoccus limosus]|uniref:DUF885 family protein n=1 Tax=Paracoccus limosus TaxID=913252 RepID=A0A844H5Z4_9RHOB|nr:DUF885 family protein [Paracoccus limosus]MTH36296.1 DUF885 family protein [Paracoccus limosus]
MCVFCGDDGLLSRRAFLRCTASGVGAALATSLPLPALAQVDSATSGSTVTGICDSFVESYIRLNPTLTGRVFGLDRSGVAVTDWSPAGSEAVATLMRDTLGALTSTPAANHKERLGAGFVEDTANSILAGYDAGEQYRKMSTHVFIGPPALLLTSFEMMSQATGGEVPLEPEAVNNDWGRILERLRAVPTGIAGYRESLEYGMARNLMAPRSMTLAVAKQCRGWAKQGWFTTFVNRYGGGTLAAPLAEAATAANRSYGELAEWLEASYAPTAAP